jgi:hypothetical protein
LREQISTALLVGEKAPDTLSVKRRWQRSDVLVLSLYVFAAAYVVFPLWAAPGLRVLPLAPGDHALFEWFLAHAARVVTHFENPFFSDLLNVPNGVNLMANASTLGLTVPLFPVTALFGPHVSVLVLYTIGPLATAAAWYFVLSRYVVRSTFAAAVGGWFCGFAPNLISHTGSHPPFTFQLLVPLIALCVQRLREPGRALRYGTVLGLLVVYQAFVSEEILLITALGCGVFAAGYVMQRPRYLTQGWRPILASLSVTTIVAGSLLAYPLWLQFFGPSHYRGLHPAHEAVTADLSSFAAFATESVAVSAHWVSRTLLQFQTEENALFGWPVLLIAGLAFLLARGPAARALKLTALVFAVLSLGAEITFRGDPTGLPGPWGLVEELPLFDSVIPSRFAFAVTVALGVLLALATQRVWDLAELRVHTARIRAIWLVALAIALVPSAPTPLGVMHQQPVPRFFTEGTWRGYVDEGETVVPLPFPTPATTTGMRWQASARLSFAIPNGFFLYPQDGVDGRFGVFGAPLRPTSLLLDRVQWSRVPPAITEADRIAAEADLEFWRAAIIVLPTTETKVKELRAAVEYLVGPAKLVEDVWLWNVKSVAG